MLNVFARRPRWAGLSFMGIIVASAVLYAWNIGYSGISTYYAASAVSMSRSWHALAFGALDPGSSMTLDKLSGFLVPQALSVNIFGVHAWALSLPQVLEGLITVLAVYALAMRWRGPVVAVIAATMTALTPMLAAMFGRPMEDGMLTMASALAVLAAQRAVISGHGRWLLVASVWVGVGFQAKMLQAWFVVPAVLLLYLLASDAPLRRRIVWACSAIGATAVASLSWIGAMQVVPATHRPYVDGSTNNNYFSMVFGYNGVDRLVPGLVPGGVPQLGTLIEGHGAVTRVGGTGHSLLKFLEPALTTQTGWLDVLAAAGVGIEVLLLLPVGGAALRRARQVLPRGRFDAGMVAALVAWVGVTVTILAPAFVPHATYFAPIAPALAVLASVATADVVRLLWVPGWRHVVLGIAGASVIWQAVIIANGPSGLVWLLGIVTGLGVVGILALAGLGSRIPTSTWKLLPVAALVASSMVAPTIWSSFVLGPGGGGSASDAYAGPRLGATATWSAIGEAGSGPAGGVGSVPLPRRPFSAPPDPVLTKDQRRLISYTSSRVRSGTPLFATDTLAIAVDVILTTRFGAMPMGGFSRAAPSPTLDQVRSMVGAGQLRFFVLADGPSQLLPNPAVRAVRSWVGAACRATLHGQFRNGSWTSQTLYDCAGAAGRGGVVRHPTGDLPAPVTFRTRR